MLAGTLTIEMVANIARLTQDMAQAKDQIRGFADFAQKAAATIAGAFSAKMFADAVKGSIDLMDHLNDLSKTTSIAVEQLAGLRVAAKQSGSDLDGAANAVNRLAQNMGKGAEKFAALGVSARDPLEALKQLSDQFVAIQDPQLRAAVMSEALGKNWQAAAPLLAEGGKRIGELVEEGSKLAGVTSEMAREADEFNDKWVKLTGTGGLLNRQVGALLPLLNELADEMLALNKAAGGGEEFKPLLEALRAIVVLAGNVAFVLKAIGNDIGAMAAQIAALGEAFTSEGMGGLRRFAEIHEQAIKDAQKAREEFDAWEKKILTVGTAADKAAHQVASLDAAMRGDFGDQSSRRAASDASARARDFLNAEKIKQEAEKIAQAFEKEMGRASAALAVAQAEAANGTDKLTASERKLLEIINDPEFKNYNASQQAAIKAAYGRAAAQERHNAAVQKYADELAKVLEEQAQFEREFAALYQSGDQAIRQVQEQIDAYQAETAAIGMTNLERDIQRIELEREKALRLDLMGTQHEAINLKYDELKALALVRDAKVMELAAQQDTVRAYDDVADRISRVAVGISKWRDELHRFIQELLALLAKKLVLTVLAQVPGLGMLGGAAAGVGQGTFAGSVINGIGSITGASSFFSGAASGFSEGMMGASFVGPSASLAGGATGIGAQLGAFMASPAGWVVAGIAAISALAYAFRDKGENWQATLGFGANANAYTSEGPFGKQGFLSIQGDDALNRQIQAFMANTVAIDKIIAGTLSQTTIDRITANLAGPYTRRNDGQPAQFAFGKGDETAGQQLTLEFLQKKYGTIFDEIDSKFADFIRNFKGTAEDLLKYIGEEAGVLNALYNTTIKGLDINALRAMGRDGESISQTLERVLTTLAQFDDAFMTDAQKIDRAKAQVAGAFAELGVAIPKDKQAFYELVHGLDLSTESGRHVFDVLMGVAGAFDSMAQAGDAAAQALAANLESFDQLMGQARGPGYTAAVQQDQLTSGIQQFMAAAGWTSGMTVQQVLEQLRTITREDFASYDAATQKLILFILGLDHSINANTSAVEDNTQVQQRAIDPAYLADAGSILQSIMGAFEQQYGGVIGAQAGLGSQLSLRSTLASGEVSRLMGRKSALEAQYGGSVDRVGEYQATLQAIAAFQQQIAGLGGDMAHLTILTAQYGQATAEQIFNLEKWYDQQKTIIGANQDALLALQKVFEQKKQDILTQSQQKQLDDTARAQADLGKFIDSLFTNQQLSPLTISQQAAQAQSQYDALLGRAQGGDAGAIRDLQGAANTLAGLERQLLGSSPLYNAFFERMVDQLAGVAKVPGYEERTIGSLDGIHVETKIMRDAMTELTTLVADGITSRDPDVKAVLGEVRDLLSRISRGNGALLSGGSV